ncbi:MAG: hypothetical protein WCS73_07710 [Lentisphaeria bacterium]
MSFSNLRELKSELQSLKRGRQFQLVVLFLFYWACIAALWLGFFVLLGFLFRPLPVFLRIIGFIGIWTIFLGGVCFYWKKLSQDFNNQAMAILLTKAFRGTGDSIINAVQLAHKGAKDNYIHALLEESPLRKKQIKITQLYPKKYRQWCWRFVAIVSLLWIVFASFFPTQTLANVQHVLLPWNSVQKFTKTHILAVYPGDIVLKRGEIINYSCKIEGAQPTAPSVEFEKKKAPAIILSMRDKNIYETASLPFVESIRYRIKAGDALTPWFKITVVSPPALVSWRAKVLPPQITGIQSFELSSEKKERGIPVSSHVFLECQTTEKLSFALLQQGVKILQEINLKNKNNFSFEFVSEEKGSFFVELTGKVKSKIKLPFVTIPDHLPTILLVNTPDIQKVKLGQKTPVTFLAKDDYGVLQVGLERVLTKGRPFQITNANPPTSRLQEFNGRFIVDTTSFDCHPGDTLSLRCWVRDGGGVSEQRRGYSQIMRLVFEEDLSSEKGKKEAIKKAKDIFAEILLLQRAARKDTGKSQERFFAGGAAITSEEIQKIEDQQTVIRTKSILLLKNKKLLGSLTDRLSGLVNLEMVEIAKRLEACFPLDATNKSTQFREIFALQTKIIAVLSGLSDNIEQEQSLLDKQTLFALIQTIIKDQRNNLQETKKKQQGESIVIAALVHNQEKIAESLQYFQDRCLNESDKRSTDDFGRQLRQCYQIIEKKQIYELMLKIADELEYKQWPNAIQYQEESLSSLMKVMNLLNQWRMNRAKKVLKEADAVLANTAEKLSELEKQQAKIAEVTRDMKKRGKLDDEVRKKLAEMDKEQEKMADDVEKLANDLYQFPELPICNELNSKMREIFEDVQQAADSENTPAIEIAVQKEDALLTAIKKTKERVEDVEMWLPDVPDNIVWNMESFDTDEFPDIPLVPLPDELEDIVGELLEQDSSIDAQSQDTTGNNIIADAEMGWGVSDGPMPSFAAKGKSGNTRPNDNEMTGRSGSGREGQASGELVENHVKGYEGRKTHARRTMDKFQKGMVTEDEKSTADARATGGGKLGGESETQGMFGIAPRRDLHTADHSKNALKLRQETEALYATAKLLYLGTGSLGAAAQNMRYMENAPAKIKDFGGIRKQVMRQLSDTQVEMRDGVVLSMPVTSVSTSSGVSVDESDYEKVSADYKELLKDYYRSLE